MNESRKYIFKRKITALDTVWKKKIPSHQKSQTKKNVSVKTKIEKEMANVLIDK